MKRTNGKIDMGILIGLLVGAAVVAGFVSIAFWDTTGKSGSGLGPDFEYNLESFPAPDPALVLYTLQLEFRTGLKQSKSLAVDADGDIYVTGDDSVKIFNITGSPIKSFSLPVMPSSMSVDDGKIYLGISGRIEVYDNTGQRISQWQANNEKSVLTSISVGSRDVFAADAGNRVVYRYNKQGVLQGAIDGKTGEDNSSGFIIPSPNFDLVIAQDGLLRIVNPGRLRIEAYSFDGTRRFFWGQPGAKTEGFCGCCNPVNIAQTPDGNFITVEKGLLRVKEYDSDGVFRGLVVLPETLHGVKKITKAIPAVFDVAVNSGGNVLVLDTLKNVVYIYEKKV